MTFGRSPWWAALALASFAHPALGLVIVGPPEVEPARALDPEPVAGAILAELNRAGIQAQRVPPAHEAALRACTTKKKCVATEGAAMHADYVVHAIVAVKQGEAFLQLTLVSVKEVKIVTTAREKAEVGAMALAVAATQGARVLVNEIQAGAGTPPIAVAPPSPSPSASPSPSPTPSPSAIGLPMPSPSPGPSAAPSLAVEAAPPEASGDNTRFAGLLIGGVGVALLAASVTSFGLAHGDASTYNGTPQVEVELREGARSRAQAEVNASLILGAGALGALTSGLIMVLAGP
ncbi:MAG: hypothetical protein U1E65_12350 [Myxococcota bacterium]